VRQLGLGAMVKKNYRGDESRAKHRPGSERIAYRHAEPVGAGYRRRPPAIADEQRERGQSGQYIRRQDIAGDGKEGHRRDCPEYEVQRPALADERAQIVAPDARDNTAQILAAVCSGLEQHLGGISAGQYRAERLVYFVSNRRCQLTGHRKSRCMRQFCALFVYRQLRRAAATALDAAGIALLKRLLTGHLDRGGCALVATHQPLELPAAQTRALALQ